MIPIPLPVIAGIAAAAICLASGWTLRGWRAEAQLEVVRGDLARAKGEHAAAAASAASAAMAQSEAHRVTEAAMRRAVEVANAGHAKDRATLVALRARADSDAVGLRDSLNTIHCAAPSGSASDPGGARGDATTPLGDVLAPLLSEYRATVEDAEAHAADARALLAGWPKVAP